MISALIRWPTASTTATRKRRCRSKNAATCCFWPELCSNSGDRREFVGRHYGQLRKWAVYLVGNGMDPASQLCTDDFAGHLAHNANLALKAILGLGAFAQAAGILGETDDAEYFRAVAEKFAAEWLKAARRRANAPVWPSIRRVPGARNTIWFMTGCSN